jgi:putative membrane protein
MTGPMPAVAAPPVSVPANDWHRVDPRTIIVRPVNELIGFAPAIIGVIVFGQQVGDQRIWYGLAAIVLFLGRGVLHWATTRYRITDEQVEVRKGLLFRRRMATRRDRVRTVESTARLGHRLFGVTAVHIGTGQNEQKHRRPIALDAVTHARADELRRTLLRRTADAVPEAPQEVPVHTPGERIAELDWRWLRYAPLTLSGLVAVGLLLGLIQRTANEVGVDVFQNGASRMLLSWARHSSVGVVIAVVVLATLVVSMFGSMIVYVFRYTSYRLTREPDATLHVRRGLLTKQAVTIEEARLRGVEVREPLLLRFGRGARLSAIATGLRHRSESHLLMPPGPVREAHRIAAAVLNTGGSPTEATLVRHPRQALRRRLIRAIVPVAVLVVGAWTATLPGWLPAWVWQAGLVLIPLAVLVGVNRFANLGHAMTGEYLVTQSGSLDRKTVALECAGIVGVQVRRSLFQRRVGLVTLTATTAAGHGAYRVLDVAESDGLALAEAAVPGLLAPFLAS